MYITRTLIGLSKDANILQSNCVINNSDFSLKILNKKALFQTYAVFFTVNNDNLDQAMHP